MSVLAAERFLGELDDHEDRLVRGVLGLRGLLVGGVIVGLLSERRGWDSRATAVAVLACWVLIASILTVWWSGETGRLAALLMSDQIVWAGFTGFGFGWRAASYFAAAAPVIIATIKVTLRWALLLVGIAAIIAVVWFGLEPIGGTDPARSAEWIPAQAGLLIAVALFSYLRYLFHGLRAAGSAYHTDVEQRSAQLRLAAAQEHRAALTRSFQQNLSERIEEVYLVLAPVPTAVGQAARDEDFAAVLDMLAEARSAIAQLAMIDDRATPEREDLDVQLTRIAGNAERRFGVPISLQADTRFTNGWSEQRCAAIGRFLDEAITNACKHGRPPIRAILRQQNGMVEIAVRDAGTGFSDEIDVLTGRGLAALRRDAAALGGSLQIDPTPGQVLLRVRFLEAEADG